MTHHSIDGASEDRLWEQCLGLPSRKPFSRRFSTRRICQAVRREAAVAFSNALVVTASTLLVLAAVGGLRASTLANTNPSSASLSVLPLSSLHGLQQHQRQQEQEQQQQRHASPSSTAAVYMLEDAQLAGHLHDIHLIPYRFLRLLSTAAKHVLLDTLRAPRKNVLGVTAKSPYVVFARINAPSLKARLNAFASVVSYARSTGRVPVVYWLVDKTFPQSFESLLRWRCTSCGKNVIIADVTRREFDSLREPSKRTQHELTNEHENQHKDEALESGDSSRRMVPFQRYSGLDSEDWADFSLEEVNPHPVTVHFHKLQKNGKVGIPRRRDAGASSGTEQGHSDGAEGKNLTLSALDAVSSMDTHVSFAASGRLRSRYTPQIEAEESLSTCIETRDKRMAPEVSVVLARMSPPAPLDDAEVTRQLHDNFHIPYMLLKGVRTVMRRLLLEKLVMKRRNGQFAPRTIWVHAQYGLGNRLRALGSAMAFARVTGRVLVLIWEPDAHLNCNFKDLFVEHDDFLVSDAFKPQDKWPFEHTKASDVAMQAVDWYNFMRKNGVRFNDPSDPVQDVPTRHIYVSTAYVIQSPVTPFIVRPQSPYWRVLKTLTPHIDVRRLVDRHSLTSLKGMMGVHIRGKTIKTDISGVGESEYSAESSRRTDYWRNITKVDTFIAEMRKQSKSQLFYVAADDKDVLATLDKEFPGRVFYTPRKCDSRDRNCLPYALADILLLARCATIRGSYWSSFSELSVRLGGAKFLLAGVDFGKPLRDEEPGRRRR